MDLDHAVLPLATYLGHTQVKHTYWYLSAIPELLALAVARFEQFAAPDQGVPLMTTTATAPNFATLVREFFCQRLIAQQNASARTVASYRDMFRLLLRFFADHRGRPPTALTLEDLDAPAILAFLDHLERGRGNSIPTRNVRLAALRSFLKYAAVRDPICLPSVQRVLAIPTKRFQRRLLGYLSREEMAAILSAPSESTWGGQRDRVLWAVMYNTGIRVSEAIGLRRSDIELTPSRTVRIEGKGRKQRVVPLWPSTTARLKEWLPQIGQEPSSPLFPNAHGGHCRAREWRNALRRRFGSPVPSARR